MTPQEAKARIIETYELGMDCRLLTKEETELYETLIEALDRQIEGNGFACDIGDTLYSVGSVTQDIVELTVEGIQITKKDTFIFCHGGIYVSVSQQLNKSVFRTREEAEDYRGRLKNEHTA